MDKMELQRYTFFAYYFENIIRGCYDRYALKKFQRQQVIVSTDNEIDIAQNGTFQHLVIIGIATNTLYCSQ